MNDSLSRIHAILDGFVRRRLGLLLGEAFARALAAWCVALALLLTFSADVPLEAGRLVVAATAVVGVIAFLWDLPAWRGAADRRRHAERVEALRPELRGVLLTVLDRSARPMGSPALLERMASKAADTLHATPPARAWPGRPFWRRSAAAFVAVLLLTFVAADRDPLGVLRRFWDGVTPVAAEAPVAAVATPDAVLGDITLRYLYPVYTRLDPVEVPNSNGEVHAPPGTVVEIKARTAEPWTQAGLRAYDELLPASIDGERVVKGSLTVAAAGVWRFEFGDAHSGTMKIVPEPDLPPDVAVQAPQAKVTLPADGQLALPFTARDDFGITKVVVEVTVGKDRREIVLRTPAETPKLVGDVLRISSSALSLPTGSKAQLRVGAWDNDAVSGVKVGWSAPISVEILGPNGSEAALWAFREGARDALLRVLADFLVDSIPPADTPAAASRWGAAADERYAAYDQLVRDTWMVAVPKKPESIWMAEVSADRRAVVGFARGLGAGEETLHDKDAGTLDDLHAKNVATLEHAILLLDQLIQIRALEALNERAKQLAADAKELDAQIDGLTAPQARARLDQLDRQFDLLAKDAAKLDNGSLKEFVTDRSGEVKSLMQSVRSALAAGKDAEAKQMMGRLSTLLQEMADGIREMQERRGGKQDQLKDAMEALKRQLQDLEAAQEALRQKAEEARQKFGQDMDNAVQTWERISALAEQVSAGLSDQDPLVRRLRMTDRGLDLALGDGSASADGLRDSARARDAETARERAENVLYDLERIASRRGSVSGRKDGPDPKDVGELAGRLRTVEKADAEILKLLDQLQSGPSEASADLQKALQQMAEEQRQIAQQTQQASEHAQNVSQQLPMGAPGLEEGTKGAARQAERAAEAMEAGDPMRTEGGQRGTEDGLREALQALEEAKENLKQMARAGRGKGEGEGKSKGEEDGDEGERSKDDEGAGLDQDVLLPAPEEFQTPEAYRRALLEGMEAEVPSTYETAKRRYYEELVRQ